MQQENVIELAGEAQETDSARSEHQSASERVGRVVRGSVWIIVGVTTGQVLKLASRVVLTWFLSPAHFGLMAIVASCLAGLQMLSDIGIEPCIVQNRDGDKEQFLRTAYTVQALRGLLLWVIACLLARPIASFYQEEMLLYVIPIASLTALFTGFISTEKSVCVRRLELGRVTVLVLSAETAGALAAVVWGVIYPSVWALVVGALVMSAALVLGSHFLHARRDHFGWHSDSLRAILRFGSLVFLSTATWFLAGHGEQLVVAKLIDLETLGVLAIALLGASAAQMVASRLSMQVLFPVLSESLRKGHSVLVRHYSRATLARVLLAIIAGGFMIILGEPLAATLLGHNYEAAGWMLRAFGARVMIDILLQGPSALMFASGKLGWAITANLLRAILTFGGCAVVLHLFGLEGLVWLLALAPLPPYLLFVGGIWKRHREVVRTEIVALLVTVLAAFILYGFTM